MSSLIILEYIVKEMYNKVKVKIYQKILWELSRQNNIGGGGGRISLKEDFLGKKKNI